MCPCDLNVAIGGFSNFVSCGGQGKAHLGKQYTHIADSER